MNKDYLKRIIKEALAEDIGQGDITTNSLVGSHVPIKASLVFKSDGIVCGLNVVEAVFKALSKKVIIKVLSKEGTVIRKGKIVAVIQGPARSVLTGERVALNFLTHLSSIATHTRHLVDEIKPYKVKLLDTRKTTPLLRELDRYAVRIGGGYNHRFNLSEMAMIKDNHRLLLKNMSLKDAVKTIKDKTKARVVVEVDTLEEFKKALTSRAEVILLDNMTPMQIAKIVTLKNRLKPKVLLEASGGISSKNIHAYAKTGVDRISVGSLTSAIKPIDISLDFNL